MQNQEPDRSKIDSGSFGAILFSRLALNMQMRVMYPFLPAISRGLGVPLETTSLLLTARAIANLSSPVYGILADRFGRRALMIAGLVILTSGSLFVVVSPTFALIMAAMAFLSLCKAVYDPAVLAYLGDVVPYGQRGRIMGILAMMWPASWLVGVPATGFLIASLHWKSPFLLICLLGGISLWLTLSLHSIGAVNSPKLRKDDHSGGSFWISWREQVVHIPASAWLALLVTLCLVLSIENVYIVYGAWLEDQFGLSTAALGVASVVICLAEFSAEGFSAGWVDRIGKRKAVIAGLCLNLCAYLLLPRLAGMLATALLGLFLVWITYDFSVVSFLPFISELAPRARGTLLALNVAAMAVARLISSLIAARLWTLGGLAANLWVSGGTILLAIVLLAGFIPELRRAQPVPLPSSD